MAVASRANSEYGQFMDEVKDMCLFPLWERVGGLKPGTKCVPAHWSYETVRGHAFGAGLEPADPLPQREQAHVLHLVHEPPVFGIRSACDRHDALPWAERATSASANCPAAARGRQPCLNWPLTIPGLPW